MDLLSKSADFNSTSFMEGLHFNEVNFSGDFIGESLGFGLDLPSDPFGEFGDLSDSQINTSSEQLGASSPSDEPEPMNIDVSGSSASGERPKRARRPAHKYQPDEDSSYDKATPVRKTRSASKKGKSTRKKSTLGKRKKEDWSESVDDSTTGPANGGLKLTYDPIKRPTNAFAFTKAEVQEILSTELDRYTQEVKAIRPLTDDEKALLKKYRRQVRNRESAQNSRARKRRERDHLETQVQKLKKEKNSMNQKLMAIDNEAASLRQRVHYLESLLDQNDIPYENSSLLPKTPSRKRGRGSNGAVKAAGVTLFLVLFSVGLFYSPTSLTASPPFPVQGDMPIPQSRDLLEYSNETPVQLVPDALPAQPAKVEKKSSITILDHDVEPVDKKAAVAVIPVSDGKEQHVAASPLIRVHDYPSRFLKWDRPNTDYLYCPAVHHVLSNQQDDQEAFPYKVSLLLPSSGFNESSSFPYNVNSVSGEMPPMVEVTASVVDVHPIWNVGQGSGHTRGMDTKGSNLMAQ